MYDNTEGFIQDNWKVNEKLTLDYGVRLVRQQPQYDSRGQASNFLLDNGSPVRRLSSTPPDARTASIRARGNNRQAMNPLTGQLLGPNTLLAIGGIVPRHRQHDERTVPLRSGHRRHDLQVAAARARAAVRHGVRHQRRPDVRAAWRHGLVLRPAERQLDLLAGPEPADLQERHRRATASCRRSAGRADD